MALIGVGEVQQWLEGTKFELTKLDDDLEASATSIVLGRLASHYDTSTWVDADSTPRLVRVSISLLVAAYTYDRYFTKDGRTLADKLEARALMIVDGILSGSLVLDEVPSTTSRPGFYPTDLTTDTWNDDRSNPTGTPRYFGLLQEP